MCAEEKNKFQRSIIIKLLEELAQPREDEDSPVLKIEYFVEDELLINIT